MTVEEETMAGMLFSIDEARIGLGGISRNSIYSLMRSGVLASVTIGCRRFVAGSAIDALIRDSSTTASPSVDQVRSHRPLQVGLVGVEAASAAGRRRQGPGGA
jgi:hypothetical protein